MNSALKILFFFSLVILFLATGCVPTSTPPPPTPTTIPEPTQAAQFTPLDGFFPAASAIPGWEAQDSLHTFTRDNLYDFVDGQSDSFFVYGFEQVSVQRYTNPQGQILNVELWQAANPADAFGIFQLNRSAQAAPFGNQGTTAPGRRITFWQNRYYVHLNAPQSLPPAELEAFAQAVTARLPTGGQPPAILQRFPKENLSGEGTRFFHEELSIQDDLYLGGENALGLSPSTDGVLAHYTLNGKNVRLLLVAYPSAEQAATGLKALKAAGLDGLLVSAAKNTLLGAVFGEVDPEAAQKLLDEAMQ